MAELAIIARRFLFLSGKFKLPRRLLTALKLTLSLLLSFYPPVFMATVRSLAGTEIRGPLHHSDRRMTRVVGTTTNGLCSQRGV